MNDVKNIIYKIKWMTSINNNNNKYHDKYCSTSHGTIYFRERGILAFNYRTDKYDEISIWHFYKMTSYKIPLSY